MKAVAFPDKRAARRSFERAAASYDAAAVVHREVGERLLQHLDPIRIEPARVMDLGCGTGEHLEALGRRFPRARLVGVDFAHGMLLRARRRAAWWRRAFGRESWLVCGDAEKIPLAAATTDLVFSNLALQWCRPEAFFAEAARILPSGGLLLFSSFGPDTLKELRAAFEAPAHVHDFIDMHDLGDELVHAGFADPVMEMETLTVEYSSVEALARDLRLTGAHNALDNRPRAPQRGRWRSMVARYEARRSGGVLPATYEVVYGHAWKLAPKHTADGRQVIDFHPRAAS